MRTKKATTIQRLVEHYASRAGSCSNLAREAGVSRQAVSQWQRGLARPSVSTLIRVLMEHGEGWPRYFALDTLREVHPVLASVLENSHNGDILSQNSNQKSIDKS